MGKSDNGIRESGSLADHDVFFFFVFPLCEKKGVFLGTKEQVKGSLDMRCIFCFFMSLFWILKLKKEENFQES